MDTRMVALTFGLAGMLGVAGAAAGQHEGHQAGVGATPSSAQVAQCRQAHPVVIGLLEGALTRLEHARLTNSPAAMRDAADDVQSALVAVRVQLAPCGEMQLASAPAAPPPPAAPAPVTPAVRPPAPPTDIADLKCTNAVSPKTVPRMLYQGRMYYFCTEASRAEFAKDPAKYAP